MKTSIYFRRNWQLYALLLLPMIYFIIFKYGPMYGVQIAFKDFNFFQGIAGSEWIGLDAFREVFQNQGFYTALRNTLVLNMLDLLVSFPAPLILAILLFELKKAWFKSWHRLYCTFLTLFRGSLLEGSYFRYSVHNPVLLTIS